MDRLTTPLAALAWISIALLGGSTFIPPTPGVQPLPAHARGLAFSAFSVSSAVKGLIKGRARIPSRQPEQNLTSAAKADCCRGVSAGLKPGPPKPATFYAW